MVRAWVAWARGRPIYGAAGRPLNGPFSGACIVGTDAGAICVDRPLPAATFLFEKRTLNSMGVLFSRPFSSARRAQPNTRPRLGARVRVLWACLGVLPAYGRDPRGSILGCPCAHLGNFIKKCLSKIGGNLSRLSVRFPPLPVTTVFFGKMVSRPYRRRKSATAAHTSALSIADTRLAFAQGAVSPRVP